MANLYFPQLLSGTLVQYPIRKVKQFRTVMNVYGDGSVTSYPDSPAARMAWQLQYTGISAMEITALQTLFAQSGGPLMPFTFIDPTDNMLVSSSDLTAAAWLRDAGCTCTSGVSDPFGAQGAFELTNASQSVAGVSQSLQVPASYQYCFSVYVRSTNSINVTMQRAAGASVQSQPFAISNSWVRLVSSGCLSHSETPLSVSLILNAGDQVQVFGPQLEAQSSPSGYRPTTSRGGVYANCHWTNSVLPVTALGPDVFGTELGIETLL